MKILLIIFKLKNKNVRNFNHLLNSSYFSDVVVVDGDLDQFSYQIKHKYDYILFGNPNFEIELQDIKHGIQQIENSKINIVQWTLRNPNYIKSNKYNFYSYRELFSPVLVPLDSQKSTIDLQTYFNAITYVKEKAYVGSRYIGRDLRNKGYKEDLINLTTALLKYTSVKKLIHIYEAEKDIVKFLDFIIDNQVFERKIDKNTQIRLLILINQKFNNIKLLQLRKHTNLHLVYRLVFKNYYDEALSALTLYRSKRYWYYIEKEMADKLGNVDFDVKETKAWKDTQKFRNLRIFSKNLFLILEKQFLKILVNLIRHFSSKTIWLISERKDSASDNSYFLFKYINRNRNDIISYYILDKTARQSKKKVEKVGKVVNFSSLKHKLLMLLADKYITAFTIEETMIPYDIETYKKIYKKELLEKDIISIQHGMIMNNISPYLHKNNYLIDYITANNKYEKNIIIETLGFNESNVLITGMTRHDNLSESSISPQKTNEILFMPTWQRGLQNLTIPQFLESNFYKEIYDLLRNKDFINFLKEENLCLNVLMHPQFEKYVQYLEIDETEITFVSMKDIEISDMIAKSKFLITDFSSIAVDFLFQQKNIIFYQYNKYAFHHVPSKQIKYSDIGQVALNLNQLITSLRKIKSNNYNLLSEYKSSYEKLFEVKKDTQKKLVDTIINLP